MNILRNSNRLKIFISGPYRLKYEHFIKEPMFFSDARAPYIRVGLTNISEQNALTSRGFSTENSFN